MVPAALAMTAKTPIGVSFDTKPFTCATARLRSDRGVSRPCFCSMPIRATPTTTLNSTTAGTTLFAKELNGFDGMNSVRKLISSGLSMSEVLKKDADSQTGKASGMHKIAARARPQESTSTAPALTASVLTC